MAEMVMPPYIKMGVTSMNGPKVQREPRLPVMVERESGYLLEYLGNPVVLTV